MRINKYGSQIITIYNDHNTGIFESWNDLKEELKVNRYIIDPNKLIFKVINNISNISISSTDILYRARINEKLKDKEDAYFTEDDLKAPPCEICNAGRLNPSGVSYLYLSDSPETCISEVRPWIGSVVEVGEFCPNHDLLIKDFTKNDNDDDKMKCLKEVLKINFSKPISGNTTQTDYMITQCITEYIKNYCKDADDKSFDGIKYYSSANRGGYNIVIFQPSIIAIKKIIGRAIIDNIRVEF